MKNDIDDLVIRNMKLVPFIINKMGLDFMYDDLVDIGWIGLLKGAIAYDKDMGLAESTVLCKYIKSYIHTYLKKPKVVELSLDVENAEDNSDLYDCIPSDFDIESEFRICCILEEIEKTLKYDMCNRKKNGINHADIISDLLGINTNQLSINEIIRKYNVSRETLKNIRNKFRKKLKERLKFILD